jgi:hypothetical protein
VPSFEDHVDYADPPIRPVLRKLKAGIIRLGRMREKVTGRLRMSGNVPDTLRQCSIVQ